MAGNENSGGIIRFKLSEKKFEEKINEYNQGTANGTILAPCPSDWYVFIEQDLESMRELMTFRGNKESAYGCNELEDLLEPQRILCLPQVSNHIRT